MLASAGQGQIRGREAIKRKRCPSNSHSGTSVLGWLRPRYTNRYTNTFGKGQQHLALPIQPHLQPCSQPGGQE